MGRLAWLLVAAIGLSACADDSSVTGTDDGTLPDRYYDGFVVGLGTRTVGNPSSPNGVDVVPTLYMSSTAGASEPDWQVNYAPSIIRWASGGVAPASALSVGRTVRVWTSTPVIYVGAGIVSADSIIVMN